MAKFAKTSKSGKAAKASNKGQKIQLNDIVEDDGVLGIVVFIEDDADDAAVLKVIGDESSEFLETGTRLHAAPLNRLRFVCRPMFLQGLNSRAVVAQRVLVMVKQAQNSLSQMEGDLNIDGLEDDFCKITNALECVITNGIEGLVKAA